MFHPLSLTAVALTATCLVTGAALPASAAPAGDFASLAGAFADPSTVDGTVTLDSDLTQGAAARLALAADQSLTLDLNGFDLTTNAIALSAGSTLTITDTSQGTPGVLTASGTLADGANVLAPINTTDATLIIEGRAHVEAVAAQNSAQPGIGAYGAAASTIIIRGDSVVRAENGRSGGGAAIAAGGAARYREDVATSSLTIGGNAQVTAIAETGGAGIGGSVQQDAGNITITDHARVTATSTIGAGIGGGYFGGNGGTIRIDGDAEVTASSERGAGIGGGTARMENGKATAGGDGAALTIAGNATVDATASSSGAGIGSGENGSDAGSLHVLDDATVTATATGYGAGIGGSTARSGGEVVLDGGSVTAANPAGFSSSAVGFGNSGHGFGSLEINDPAVLTIPSGSVLRIPEGITVPGDGELRGDGTVVNNGAVQLATADVDWSVLGLLPNNYLTTFHANGGDGTADVRTFATSFTAGARMLPAAPTRAGFDHLGWADSVDGSSTRAAVTFDLNTPLTGDRTLYAQWVAHTRTAAVLAGEPQVGEDLAVDATVTAVDPVAGIPVGTAQLVVDGEAVGPQVPVDATGAATLSYPDVTAGEHTLRVDFTPTSALWLGSVSPELQIAPVADPGNTDPGTTNPGTTNPGTTNPGTTTPGTAPATGLAVTGPAAVALWGGLAVLVLAAGGAAVAMTRRRQAVAGR